MNPQEVFCLNPDCPAKGQRVFLSNENRAT